MNDTPKPERPLYLDLDFGEALARYARTKPEEVTPAPGQKRKPSRPGPKPKPVEPPSD
jgi:hypothetical protein